MNYIEKWLNTKKENKTKLRYTVSQNKEGLWVVWKEVEVGHGIASRSIYSDTSKKKCYDFKKKIGG